MLGKKENYFAPSCAVLVVNLGAQGIVGHVIAELIDRSLSRDTCHFPRGGPNSSARFLAVAAEYQPRYEPDHDIDIFGR